MSIISPEFFIFISVLLVVYWNIPGRFQWLLLLVASGIFYILNAPVFTLIYIGISVVTVYFATIYFEKRENKTGVLVGTLIIILGTLAVLKYTNLFVGTLFMILRIPYTRINWVAPLAISFYTLQLVAYTLDCYWKVCRPEKNILKLLLYTIYFPQMVSGPISRYNELGKYLFEKHRFEYSRVTLGFKRIAWGMTKKLFIAAKLKLFADAIFNNPTHFTGTWIWLGIVLFVIELYADFSGCMDIIIGVSTCLGIEMTENFNAPLLSRSIQEFWQRWHITLGLFLRDYLMNSLLKSKIFVAFGTVTKKILGKKNGKKIPAYLAMFVVWMAMGIWHGSGWRYVFGQGLWFWLIIALEQIFSPLTRELRKKRLYNLFCLFRTFILFCIGMTFFRADSYLSAITMFKLGMTKTENWNIVRLIKDHGIGRVALGDVTGILLLMLTLLFLVVFEIVKYNGKNPYNFISNRTWSIRWGVYWILIITIVYNMFGTQSNFIYAGF